MNKLKIQWKNTLMVLVVMLNPFFSMAVADEDRIKLDEGTIDYFNPNSRELVVNDNSYFMTDKLVIIQNGERVSIDTLDKRKRVTVFGTNNEDSE